MGKLILQVQMSVDGFTGAPDGGLGWMEWNWGDDIKAYVDGLTARAGTILMGRKMTDGFIKYWSSVTEDAGKLEYDFARKMIDTPKVVFTKTLEKSGWINTVLAKGDISKEVKKIKNNSEKDIIVYGGAGFVSNLIKNGLIDEYHLFINPSAIGSGLTIFASLSSRLSLSLKNVQRFDCGIAVMHYEPNKITLTYRGKRCKK